MAELSKSELALLEEHFLFRGAGPAVAEDCRVRTVEKNETIYTPRDYAKALGILLSGRVRVSKEGFLVSVLERGDAFGAAALFNDREDYPATLTALTPCRVVFFSQRGMAELMAHNPAVAGNYIRYLSGRIRFLEGRLDNLLAPSAKHKLAQYLLERRVGETVTLDCSMSDLAQRLDLGRTSLYRAFDLLAEAGAIAKKGKEIRILKEEALL